MSYPYKIAFSPLPPRFHLLKDIATVIPSDLQSTRHYLKYVVHSSTNPLTAVSLHILSRRLE